jgi:hypothetical protein
MTAPPNDPMPLARTTTVYRPLGGVESFREIRDEITDVAVTYVPWATLKELPTSSAPASYVLANHAFSYFGESNDFRRRLNEHARDTNKAWVREAYVISGMSKTSELWSDPWTAKYFQYRLTELADKADLVEVIKGVAPQLPQLTASKRATLEALVQQTMPLLFDAGCRAFHSNCASQRRPRHEVEPAGADEAGPMEIGVAATPPVGGELDLAYGELWARGFSHERGFVVMPGSDVRATSNPSARDWVETKRNRLRASGGLVEIPGLVDRERLCVSLGFASASAATQLVTGSRDGGRWVPIRHPQPILDIV